MVEIQKRGQFLDHSFGANGSAIRFVDVLRQSAGLLTDVLKTRFLSNLVAEFNDEPEMLVAAGLEIYTDNQRQADENNP